VFPCFSGVVRRNAVSLYFNPLKYIPMKEVEKNEIKRLSDRLDLIGHQQASLSLVESAEKYAELEKEKETIKVELERLRSQYGQKLSKEAQKLMSMPFKRAITKKEQADLGKLKKSVRGLVVVHQMTALGREMGLKEMTGFSKTDF
jgi:ribosome-associated protein